MSPLLVHRPTCSVVIPCYNEEKTLETCVLRVVALQNETLALEILIVDDCSSDRSRSIAKRLAVEHPQVTLFVHPVNQGKGAAIRTGFAHASGDFVAIQDADLELDPRDLRRLLTPLLENQADVAFGSRFLNPARGRRAAPLHFAANKFLTLLSNCCSGLRITDMECCYKLFRRDIARQITICENRFGVEPELVAKTARLGPRIAEMGISYVHRTRQEGKKIGFRDGLRAILCILKYNAPTLGHRLGLTKK